MKIIIELDDPNISAQVSKAIDEHVGRLTAQHLDDTMSRVLDVKVERVTNKMVEEIVERKVSAAITEAIGGVGYHGKRSKLREIIGEEARKLLNKANT